MPTYSKCGREVLDLASDILTEYPDYKPLLDAHVQIDYLFAYPPYDEHDQPIGPAIRHHGRTVRGLARVVGLKDRAAGRGDAEILLDGHYWEHDTTTPQKKALLDHELHYLVLARDKFDIAKRDDLHRPMLTLRPHDAEFGWFALIAERHGVESLERIQAAKLVDAFGQYFFPDFVK